jgi:hypothetical protein
MRGLSVVGILLTSQFLLPASAHDASRKTSRLQPIALRLTPKEQEIVLKATRTPTKVRWPDWWVVMP